MPKAYSADMRERVIAEVEGGASRREAAEEFEVAGEFDVVEIQGGHDDMFNEPGVQSTAATLAACLRDHPRGEHQSGLSPDFAAHL